MENEMHTNTTKPKRQLDNGRDQSVQRAPLPQRKSVAPPRRGPAVAGRSPSAAPFISKIANAEHEETGDGFDIFQFRKPLGRVGTVSIARDEAVNEVAVLKKIRQKNGVLPKLDAAATQIVRAAISSEPREYRLLSQHTGWRLDDECFVLLNRVINFGSSELKVCPPPWTEQLSFGPVSAVGTIETWKETVAAEAQYSTRLMLMVSCAFAAPLLRLVGRPPFIINVFGRSKVGKTTGLLAATSVIGIGQEEGLPNWNTTDAGLMEVARLFNDSLVPANELALMKGGKADRRIRVKQLIYAFGEGRDTTRHSESSFATPRGSVTFRGILVSTSEKSFQQQANEALETRDDGEIARAHDVPAISKGSTTIFDRLPEHTQSGARGARKRLVALRQACALSSGYAMVHFIKLVGKHEAEIAKQAPALVQEFVSSLHISEEDGPLMHAAGNFGIIFAGGALAIKAGLLDWDHDLLRTAIARCFEDFRNACERPEDSIARARRHLADAVAKLKMPSVRSVATLESTPKVGVWTKDEKGWIAVIHSMRFDAMFPDQTMARDALIWLDERGWLRKTKQANAATRDNKKWAERIVKVNDGRNKFRAIMFRWPRNNAAPSKK
jgi:putative DNA primase/helicase